jgi:hypothetical protein
MCSKIEASFYDLSDIVFAPQEGFCQKSELIPLYKDDKLLKKYLIDNDINIGDIIFIGGNIDRMEYCFKIVTEDRNLIDGELGESILFAPRNKKYLEEIKNKNISYEKVLNEINDDETFRDLFFCTNEDDYFDSCITRYHNNNLI